MRANVTSKLALRYGLKAHVTGSMQCGVRSASATESGISFATFASMKTMSQKCGLAPPAKAASGLGPRPSRPIITYDDRRRLGSLATDEDLSPIPQAIGALDARLDDAVYVERDEIPASVVTMSSTVELVNLRTHERLPATLVYPDDAEFVDDSTSVLEPLGIALLGSSVGSVIQCREGRGIASFKVERIIHQPEQ
jgi:regulator of nucleoside diphosphate kinase